MSTGTGKHAAGAYVEYSTDNATWSTHLEVAMINSPGRKRRIAKATHLESPDGYAENRPALKEVSPFKGTLIFRDDQYQALETLFEAGTLTYIRISDPLEEGQSTPDRTVIKTFISDLGEKKLDPEDTTVEVYDIEFTHWGAKPVFTPGS